MIPFLTILIILLIFIVNDLRDAYENKNWKMIFIYLCFDIVSIVLVWLYMFDRTLLVSNPSKWIEDIVLMFMGGN